MAEHGISIDIDISKILTRVTDEVKIEVDKAMTKGAYLAHHEINKMLNQEISVGKPRPRWNSATGQRRSGTSYYSKYGDAPNTDTGRLVQSMRISKDTPFLKYVKTDIGYAKYLENPQKLNRPFLSTAVKRIQKPLAGMIEKAVIKGMNKF